MMVVKFRLCAIGLAALLLGFAGCGGSGPSHPEGLSGLSETELSAVLDQRLCPVCNAQLGAKGAPVKFSAEGKEIYACSADCQRQFEAEPKKYLPTLQKISDE